MAFTRVSELSRARGQAAELRKSLAVTGADLLPGVVALLKSKHGLQVEPASKEFLSGARGTVVPGEGCVYYDKSLDPNSPELLEVLAHELGHLMLHSSRFQPAGQDLMRGSAFLTTGSAALTRYSPKAREEAEANAFAAELICPAREVFTFWLERDGTTLQELSESFFSTVTLVRQQLSEGLLLFSSPRETVSHRGHGAATKEQEEAATFIGAPVIVDAGPGTGKTRTLIRRVEFLVKEKSIKPETILILTFSNEAAGELRERLSDQLGEITANAICVSTFHGFGLQVLHSLGHHIGLDDKQSILDESAQGELLSDLLGVVECESILDLKRPEATVEEVLRHINYLKDRLILPHQLKDAIGSWSSDFDKSVAERSKALLGLYEKYEELKDSRNCLDFSDLILKPVQMLTGNQEVQDLVRAQYRWVLVDEYQDVSRATSVLLAKICSRSSPPWVVGDQRQAIYRFRGACPENVANFSQDFPGARPFKLTVNYRSASAVVDLANQLADFLSDGQKESGGAARWVAGNAIPTVGDHPVRLFEAASDSAERKGIVTEIKEWLRQGVAPHDIAVLARRNIDVRNIAVALKQQGVRAITTGLLTAEGAGGDLAALLTCPEGNATLARFVYCLHRHRFSPETLNEAVAYLLKLDRDDEAIHVHGLSDGATSIVHSVWPALYGLRKNKSARDGWATLCDFLFFDTDYTRRLLGADNDAESLVQLDEIFSVLAMAAGYRAAHPHDQPRRARLGLADLVRSTVTKPVPGLVPPRSQAGAVRVMTCHASKGLEFPCVVVAGQALPNLLRQRQCLPPSLRADPNDELLQADSLLFVGVTRAKRAVVVSFASTAGGGPKSPKRLRPKLLIHWMESGAISSSQWGHHALAPTQCRLPRIWGGEGVSQATAYQLNEDVCTIRTYLEDQLRLKIPVRDDALYPFFIIKLRATISRVLDAAATAGSVYPSEAKLLRIFEEQWPKNLHIEHPHYRIYRPRIWIWIRRLGDRFPGDFRGTKIETELVSFASPDGSERQIGLSPLYHISEGKGRHTFIQLRIQGKEDKETVPWSKLPEHQRLTFALMHGQFKSILPLVLDIDEGVFRRFEWKRGDKEGVAIKQATSRAQAGLHALCDGQFEAEQNDFQCDRCRVRLNCPLFIGAS